MKKRDQRVLCEFDFAPITGAKAAVVDATNGIIYGASVITGEVTARGHNLQVDDKTLKQMLACAQGKGQVSVKTNHGTGADAVNGYLTNFRIEAGKLLGDWHLLKTHKDYDHVLEMAERMPRNIGLSAAFLGLPETAEGHKVVTTDKGVDEVLGPKGKRTLKPGEAKFARCEEIVSVDLVAQPAANPGGLFSAKESRLTESAYKRTVDNPRAGMAKNQVSQEGAVEGAETQEPTLAEVLQAIQESNSRMEEMAGRLEQIEDFQEQLARDLGDEGENEEDFENEDEQELVHAGGGGEGGEFQAVNRLVTQFEAKLSRMEQQAEAEQFAAAFDEVKEKTILLAQQNDDQLVQLQAQHDLIQELQAQIKKQPTAISASGETMFQARAVKAGAGVTEFEARVSTLLAEKKGTRGECVKLAMSEDPARYAQHLQAKALQSMGAQAAE